MESIPPWFKYPHVLIFICLLFLPIFIFQVFKGVFSPNAGPKHSRNKSIVLKFSFFTRYFLCFSVILSYSYVMTTSAQSTLMWINLSSHSYSIFTPQIWCPLLASYRMFSYVTGRSLLYCYFIYRTNDIFAGTYLEFTKYSKYGLVTWIAFIIISLVIPSSYIYFKLQNWIIITDETNNGSYCKSDDNAANYIRYIFMWGSLNDMTYSIITIFMMVSRIFLLLTDNERKKSKSKRYEYHSSKDSNRNIEPVQSNDNGMTHSPPESPRHMQPESRIVSMSPMSSRNGSPSPIAGTLNATYTFPEEENDNIVIEKSKTKTKSKTRSSRRLKKQVTISKLDAIQFHDKTHRHNKLILLISKFFILLSSVVISSQVVLILFIILRDFVLILYSLDSIINIVCLWLTFNFSDMYYNKYFCGRCCTKCCFPPIKAITLTCSQYEILYQQTHNMNNKCCASKCCIYCKCCCFASCRYGCCTNNNTPKEIYKLAKYEIELMVEANDEKSINMSQMSKNESQKDVMMSSIDKTEKSYAD